MDLTTVFDFTVPTLHPLATHLPLVAIPAAAVAGIGYAVLGSLRWLYAALGTALVGAAGALFATRTGEALYDEMEGDPMLELLGEAHEWSAEWALYTAAAGALVLAVLAWRARREEPVAPGWMRGLAALLLVASAALVLYAGHVGATMVWGIPAG
jgi:uncharacterized membrane protein